MKKTFCIIAVLLAFGGAMTVPTLRTQADGFGITPPYVTNPQLAQDSHYEQTILLVRSDPTDDLQTNISINVPGADSWISIDRGTQFVLPAGVQEEPMIVSVNVPKDAKLGAYAGSIDVVVSPLGGPTKGTVGITIGARIDVNIDVVSDKSAKLTVRRALIENNATEVGHTFWWMHFPGRILFDMDLANGGNIPGAPAKVVFQYEDYLTGNVLETEQNTNSLASVDPFGAKTVTAEMPIYLPQGSYHVSYQIFDTTGNSVIGQGNLDLSVLPPGTLSGYIGYGFEGLRLGEKLITIAVGLGALGFLYLLFLGIRSIMGRRRGRGRRIPMPPPPPPRYR